MLKQILKVFNSLYFKLLVLIIISIVVVSAVSIRMHRTSIEKIFKESLMKETSLILSSLEGAISPLLETKERESVQRLLENIGSYSLVKNIYISEDDGYVLASSDVFETGKIKTSPLLDDIFVKKKLTARISEFDKGLYVEAIPIKGYKYNRNNQSDVNAALVISMNVKATRKVLYTSRDLFIIQDIVIGVVLSVLLALSLYVFIFHRLKKITKGADEVSKGNYDFRIKAKGNDEFGRFAKVFNEMTQKIRQRQKLITTYSNQLELEVGKRTQELLDTIEELKTAQGQLVQQEKLASIGQLAAGVAHEINNPIGFIKSNTETLKTYIETFKTILDLYQKGESKKLIKEKEKEEDLEFIIDDVDGIFSENQNGLKRITEIVRNLKDFARPEEDKGIDMMSINDSVKNTLIVANNEIKYHAETEVESSSVSEIFANKSQINQVLLNILINAAQAIGESKREGKGIIKIKTYEDDGYVYCSIEDNGPGIPKDIQASIFDPFFTTKAPGKGTGLGLNISYDIVVNKHKGDILIESEEGEGTKFTIKLPKNNVEVLDEGEKDE